MNRSGSKMPSNQINESIIQHTRSLSDSPLSLFLSAKFSSLSFFFNRFTKLLVFLLPMKIFNHLMISRIFSFISALENNTKRI